MSGLSLKQPNENDVVNVVPSNSSQVNVAPSDWISAVIYAGVQAANMIANKRSQKRQNAYNKEAAELEYQRNIAQWQRENEYNSPASVMARLKEAGINPVLAYGGSAQSQAAASPQYKAPDADYSNVTLSNLQGSLPNLFQVISQYQQLQMNAQNLELQKLKVNQEQERQPWYRLNALNEYNTIGAKLEGLNIGNMKLGLEKDIKVNEKDISDATKQSTIDKIKRLAEKVGYDTDISKFRKELEETLLPYNKSGVQNNKRQLFLRQKISKGQATSAEVQEYISNVILEGIPSILSGAAQGFGNLGSTLFDIYRSTNPRFNNVEQIFEDISTNPDGSKSRQRTTIKKKVRRKK